ncbi:MAG: ATP-binding protein [Myxococcota bacterium]
MRRFSIPTRIFAAFLLTIAGFVSVSAISVWQHERTAQDLRLLREGYLPLAIRVSEARVLHRSVSGQLSRDLAAQPDVLRRFKAALQLRPSTLRQIDFRLGRAERLAERAGRGGALRNVRASFDSVGRAFGELAARYETLLVEFENGRDDQAARQDAAQLEGEVRASLTEINDGLKSLLGSISAGVAERERQASVVLGVLTLLALVVALFVTFYSRRLLGPLPRLQERVAALREGDLSPRKPISTADDEIGRLAADFEAMVEALAARDARLNETKERLLASERLAAIGRMAAHVTHEVRNPLSSIGLNVEMLGDELDASQGEAAALMDAIQREIERLRGITEEYLRLARVPSPQLQPEDPADFADDLVTFFRKEIEVGGLDFEVSIEEGLPETPMDDGQFRQALLNLLRNAREAAETTVGFHVKRSGEDVVFTVEDDGPGIGEADQERIFDMFYTTKKGGSGLGLPLTQQIVLAHEGRIETSARANGGTRFRVTLRASSAL